MAWSSRTIPLQTVENQKHCYQPGCFTAYSISQVLTESGLLPETSLYKSLSFCHAGESHTSNSQPKPDSKGRKHIIKSRQWRARNDSPQDIPEHNTLLKQCGHAPSNR